MKYLALMMVAFLGLLGISQAQVMVVYQLSASSIEVGDAFKDDSTPAGSTKRRHYSGVAIHDVASGRVMIVWRTKDKNRKLQETRDYGLNMVNYRPQSADRIFDVFAMNTAADTNNDTVSDYFTSALIQGTNSRQVDVGGGSNVVLARTKKGAEWEVLELTNSYVRTTISWRYDAKSSQFANTELTDLNGDSAVDLVDLQLLWNRKFKISGYIDGVL